MSAAGGKWAYVLPCGCVYGVRFDIDGTITTPMQAWAAFYDKQPKQRAKDEREGCSVREWQDGDHLQFEGCPHKAEPVSDPNALDLFGDAS